MKKAFIISGIVVIIGIAGLAYYIYKQRLYLKENVPAAVEITQIERQSQQQAESPEIATQQLQLPPELNIKMTFYSQAPFGNWDYPWQEACEEASALLVANTYFSHNWTREEFRDEILKLVDWEDRHFGDYKDTTNAQIAILLRDYLHLESVTHQNPTYDDIRKALAKGHLIIMTFAGREIGNPFYTNGGPIYHAMVIKGYKDGGKVITEDVGTKRGEDYVYSWNKLYEALHDYSQPIDNGAKMMIEVLPPRF